MRVTEQGEVIAQKYANRVTATFQLERLLAGVTRTSLLHSVPNHATQPLESIWPKVAETSFQAYRKLIETDGFVTFFRQATPIDVIEQTQLGSVRHAAAEPERWTTSAPSLGVQLEPGRFHLPGWYGVGTALDWLRREDGQHLLDWPFLSYLLHNVEASLMMAHPGTMRLYASLVEDEEIRTRLLDTIFKEYNLSVSVIEHLFAKQPSIASASPKPSACGEAPWTSSIGNKCACCDPGAATQEKKP